MKSPLITALIIATCLSPLPTIAADKGATATELKQIEGTWVGGVKNKGVKGKSADSTMIVISEFVVKDGKIASCKDKNGVSLGTCETMSLNPATRTLDASGSLKDGRKGSYQGIYRVNGDTLEWCAANPGIPRPEDFFTTPQVQFHMVFNRKK